MATTITSATFTSTITESINLNGSEQGSTNTVTISSVNEIFKRIISVPTSPEVTLYTTNASTVQGSVFDVDLVQYVRVTNLDDANWCAIRVTDANSDEFIMKLEAGKSFVLGTHSNDGADGAMSAGKAENAGAVPDAAIVSMEAQANSGTCDLEIFIAST
tara:strand:+ start:552 stop:1031 length:480 start_codon:yes stop_codon:yes gene_type:complete